MQKKNNEIRTLYKKRRLQDMFFFHDEGVCSIIDNDRKVVLGQKNAFVITPAVSI